MARILTIDDDRVVRAVVAAALSEAGHEVLEADTGDGGLEAARRERPDLVLLDIGLPGIHGTKVLDEIKADPDLAAVPVIMVSGRRRLGRLGGRTSTHCRLGASMWPLADTHHLDLRIALLAEAQQGSSTAGTFGSSASPTGRSSGDIRPAGCIACIPTSSPSAIG